MDQNGDCRDKAVDLESIIDFPQTYSKLGKTNLDQFKERARELLSFKDTYVWIKNGDLYTPIFQGPLRFQGFLVKAPEKKEYFLSFRGNMGEEHSIRINSKYKPEYSFLYEKSNGSNLDNVAKNKVAVGLSLSTMDGGLKRTTIYTVKKIISSGNNHHPYSE